MRKYVGILGGGKLDEKICIKTGASVALHKRILVRPTFRRKILKKTLVRCQRNWTMSRTLHKVTPLI